MDIFLQVLLLLAGFVCLIKGADWFVDGASCIAAKLGIPQIVIGLTIVALGTSAPEAAVSITAALKGSAGITVGNVLGSNIMNIFLILGITSIIAPVAVKKNTIHFEMPFLIFVSILFPVLGIIGWTLGLIDGIILWILTFAFIFYLIQISKSERKIEKTDESMPKMPVGIKSRWWYMIIITILGLGLIILGSNLTVNSATYIAQSFGVSDRLIGLTIVAFGTSLPELVTSAMAAKKGKCDIAIGNIVGSNIFNILFVAGTSALITSVPFSPSFIVDSIASALAAIVLILCCLWKKKLTRTTGIIMICCYAAYFTYLIITNLGA